MTAELVAWLREQLDADLAALNAWDAACIHLEACGDTSPFTERFDLDGERWRADLDSKRRILDECVADLEQRGDGALQGQVDRPTWTILCLLALPYADRAGYRDEWRPA